MSARVIDVLVPVALDQPFYPVPAGLSLRPGDMAMRLPLRGEPMGVVWAEKWNSRLHNRMKDVADELGSRASNPELRKFGRRLRASRHFAAVGAVWAPGPHHNTSRVGFFPFPATCARVLSVASPTASRTAKGAARGWRRARV